MGEGVATTARSFERCRCNALPRAEVTALAQQLSSAGPAEAAAPRQVLEHLRFFPALARVRNPALANFPDPERQAW